MDVKQYNALVECLQSLVLIWNCHALQIAMVPHGLKITADKKKVDFVRMLCF